MKIPFNTISPIVECSEDNAGRVEERENEEKIVKRASGL